MNDDRLNRVSASAEMPRKTKSKPKDLVNVRTSKPSSEIPLTIRLRVVDAIILEAERKIAEDLRMPSLVVDRIVNIEPVEKGQSSVLSPS